MSSTHPIHALNAAEAALVAQLNAAADTFDAVGSSALDAAMDRLQASAAAAAQRLASAGQLAHTLAGNLLAQIGGMTAALTQPTTPPPAAPTPLKAIEPEATPAPIAAPAPEFVAGHADPAPSLPSWLAGGLVGAVAQAAQPEEWPGKHFDPESPEGQLELERSRAGGHDAFDNPPDETIDLAAEPTVGPPWNAPGESQAEAHPPANRLLGHGGGRNGRPRKRA